MKPKNNVHLRVRGHAGVRLRRGRLNKEPLCRLCKAKGRVRASTVPDHIVPLGLGGTESESNIRCLCADCHKEVTAKQFGQKIKPTFGEDGWPI